MWKIVDGPELNRHLKKATKSARNADFAVAFWGLGATDEIGIRPEVSTRIVCNLLSGGTNPDEIRKLMSQGADVRQLNTLHAKIGIIDNFCFLGSSNMSTNGLSSEGSQDGWLEVNIICECDHTEISKKFENFWSEANEIKEVHLLKAKEVWEARKRGGAIVAAIQKRLNIIDVLRDSPEHLDALNVRMIVYDKLTMEDDLLMMERVDAEVQEEYGNKFETFWGWDSLATKAQNAYLISFDRSSKGTISGGDVYCRDAKKFPDFEKDGEKFYPAFHVPDIEGITVGARDKAIIRSAFHAYVESGEKGEEDNCYNFLISELAPYIPPKNNNI